MTKFYAMADVIYSRAQRLSAATSARYRNNPLPRNSVDHWLSTAIKRPGITSGMQEGYVVCLVERVCVQASENDCTVEGVPTHTLYISAHVFFGAGGPHPFGQSPLAILDRFVGHQHGRHAPRWTRWTRSSIIFKHRTVSFARLFLHIATSKENLDEPGLPLIMTAWARSITQANGPATPQNQQVFVDVQDCNSRQDVGAYNEDSPITTRYNGTSDVEHSDGDCDAEMDAFVPRILDFGPAPLALRSHDT